MEGLVLVILFMICLAGLFFIFYTFMEYGLLGGLLMWGLNVLFIFVIVKLVQFIF